MIDVPLVFGAGTMRWSWGLDSNHDSEPSIPDVRMQQATVNLFADMGVQPFRLLVQGEHPARMHGNVIPGRHRFAGFRLAGIPVGADIEMRTQEDRQCV